MNRQCSLLSYRDLYPKRAAFYGHLSYTSLVKTALVVDDDETIRKFVRLALEKRGWTVLEAEDGTDGVARFMLHYPEVLITDLSMPKRDGFELVQYLQESGDLKGARLVIMSGVLDLNEEVLKKTGAHALLRKPFNLRELYIAVEG